MLVYVSSANDTNLYSRRRYKMNFEVGWVSLVNNTIMALVFFLLIVITYDEIRYSKFDIKKDRAVGIVAFITLVVLFLWTLKAIKEGLGL